MCKYCAEKQQEELHKVVPPERDEVRISELKSPKMKIKKLTSAYEISALSSKESNKDSKMSNNKAKSNFSSQVRNLHSME